MPDQGSNEHGLEGRQGPASAALTLQHSPAPPGVGRPRRLDHRGPARTRAGGRPLRPKAPPRVLHRRDPQPQYPFRLRPGGRTLLPVV